MNNDLKDFKETLSAFFDNFENDTHSKIVIDYLFKLIYGIKNE